MFGSEYDSSIRALVRDTLFHQHHLHSVCYVIEKLPSTEEKYYNCPSRHYLIVNRFLRD